MHIRKAQFLCAVSLTVVCVTAVSTAPATAGTDAVDPVAAVRAATPDTVRDAAGIGATDSATVVMGVNVPDSDLAVPVDPTDGIRMSGGRGGLQIGLPYAMTAGPAKLEQAGVVSYDNGNDSVTLPVLLPGAGVQINTVIESPDAPEMYAYDIAVAGGGELVQLGDVVVILDENGAQLAVVPEPWALDAAGNDVPSHYIVQGDVLTQVVEHRGNEVVYPVVADPKFAWAGVLPSVKTTRAETNLLRGFGAGPGGPSVVAVKACERFVTAAAVAGAILCGANIISIMTNARRIYAQGKCAQLLIGPGVIGTVGYKDEYCR